MPYAIVDAWDRPLADGFPSRESARRWLSRRRPWQLSASQGEWQTRVESEHEKELLLRHDPALVAVQHPEQYYTIHYTRR